MKSSYVLWFASAVLLCGQSPAPKAPAAAEVKPETVVAEVDGHKVTAAEFEQIVGMLPPQMKQIDRKALIQNYGLMRKLATIAEQDKLDQKTPYKEALAAQRTNMLMNAAINERMNQFVVTDEDRHRRYKEQADRYKQVKLKVIYIAFNNNPEATGAGAKKILTEDEAKAKAARLVAELRAGADFVKLAKENSDDEKSAKENGDFATLRKSDNVPDSIRATVFNLKKGDISEPVRQPNGYYIFRAEEIGMQPFEQVNEEVYNEIRQTRLKAWLDDMRTSIKIKVESEQFFGGAPAPASASGK